MTTLKKPPGGSLGELLLSQDAAREDFEKIKAALKRQCQEDLRSTAEAPRERESKP